MVLQNSFWAKVVTICDGDSLTVWAGGPRIRIRVAWIDAPEDGQPGCLEARSELQRSLGSENVKVQCIAPDCYGRQIARLWNERGEEISEMMLRSGWAVYYAPRFKSEYHQKIEAEAREEGVGLWGLRHFEWPVEYRRSLRKRR